MVCDKRILLVIATLSIRKSWVSLLVPYDVGRYYRRLFLGQFGLKLEMPSRGEHITVISPEDKVDSDRIAVYNGSQCKFDVSLNLEWNGSAIWLPVISSDVGQFRQSLGLPPKTLHFCIGYIK